MTLMRYEPSRLLDTFSDFWNLRSDIDRIFDEFFGGRLERKAEWSFQPAVDIHEEKDRYVVKAELPGMKQDDIKVTITDNLLTLSGERKYEHKEDDKGYHRVECSYGKFYRSFRLPGDVDSNKIKAEYRDGILEISIPKSERAKPKEIKVKVH